MVISSDANNDGLISGAELTGPIAVTVTLPAGAVAGDTLTITDGTTTTTVVLSAAQISAGTLATSFASPGNGNTLTVSAQLSDTAGNVGTQANTTIKVIAPVLPGDSINPTTAFGPKSDRSNEIGDGFRYLVTLQPEQREALFVQFAVRESQGTSSYTAGFEAFVKDVGTANDEANRPLDVRVLPIETRNHLYVQSAVRGQVVGFEPDQFVHNAVLQSQIEATIRHSNITSASKLINPNSSPLFAFDLRSPISEPSVALASAQTSQDMADVVISALGENADTADTNKLEAPTAMGIRLEAPEFEETVKTTGSRAHDRQMAAASFTRQVSHESGRLRSTVPIF